MNTARPLIKEADSHILLFLRVGVIGKIEMGFLSLHVYEYVLVQVQYSVRYILLMGTNSSEGLWRSAGPLLLCFR